MLVYVCFFIAVMSALLNATKTELTGSRVEPHGVSHCPVIGLLQLSAGQSTVVNGWLLIGMVLAGFMTELKRTNTEGSS